MTDPPAFQRLNSQVENVIQADTPLLRVLLHVEGIHCPSCVEHINRLLQSLSPLDTIHDISVSFLDHTVRFCLPLRQKQLGENRATVKRVMAKLSEEGYGPSAVDGKVINATASAKGDEEQKITLHELIEDTCGEQGQETSSWFHSTWRRIFHPRESAERGNAEEEKQRRWERHLQACKSCSAGGQGHPDIIEQQRHSSPSSSSSEEGEWVAALTVGGMTCSSCVANVQSVAKVEDGVQSIEVSLISASARLVASTEDSIRKAVEAINDAGYDAAVVSKDAIAKEQDERQVWKAVYSVQGMTCASCVSNVERTVMAAEPGLLSFHVALMHASAAATMEANDASSARKTAMGISEAIEEAGYDCSLQDVTRKEKQERSTERTVVIRIDGIFCSHCTSKTQRYLRDETAIRVDEPALSAMSLSSPIITIAYTPSSTTTIRSILADIDALDPAFHATLVTPPSIASQGALHAQKELTSLAIRITAAFLFVPPTLLIAVIVPTFLPDNHPLSVALSRPVLGQATLADVTLWALSTPVQFAVGSLFHARAYKSLRSVWRRGRSWKDRTIRWGDMNVLVSLGTSIAYLASLAFLIIDARRRPAEAEKGEMEKGSSMTYFDACVFLIFFILLGRVLEAWSKRKTSSAVSALGSLRPSTGLLLQDPAGLTSSAVETLPVELLEVGDLVLVPCGSSPPLDSTFVSTPLQPSCTFLEAAISGESHAVAKEGGDQLYAGTVNQSQSAIIARVNTLAGSNLIDNVIDIVQSSSMRKADIEQLADRVTSHFVPIIVLLALVVLTIWLALLYSPQGLSEKWKLRHIERLNQPGSQFLYALQYAVSVLVVACPCGIGLAAPTAQIIAIGLASKQGILVQGGGQAFQSAVRLAGQKGEKAFVFDKTGTITHGDSGNVCDAHLDSILAKGWSLEALRGAVWLMEGSSAHPIASGVRKWCEAAPMDSSAIQLEAVEEVPGRGLRGRTKTPTEATVLVGSMALMEEEGAGAAITEANKEKAAKWQRGGASVIYIGLCTNQERKVIAVLSLADTVRGDAKPTLSYLQRKYRGQLWMVSGDTRQSAQAIASQVGIAEANVVAGVLPAEKAQWIERIRRMGGDLERQDSDGKGKKSSMVAFVGDGVNDAPALSTADLSIALGSGSSLATSTASFILLNPERPLAAIPSILSLSKATQNKIWQNLAWACAFNAIAIPIAAGAFIERGFTFGPSWSGLAMALSSVSVVLNALTLRLWRPPKM